MSAVTAETAARTPSSHQAESRLMVWLRSCGMERLAWSVRRLHVPVPPGALVLEVGSGDNPYPRANVLLDAYEESGERARPGLVRDRPLVIGSLERLPFRDGAFDFVIASHVLEHLSDVEAGIRELMRVGRGGYIETPDALFERLNPYAFHRLEIADTQGRLKIHRKNDWVGDPYLVALFERRAKALDLTARFPFDFHVRFYWSGRIDYDIDNPAEAWHGPDTFEPDAAGSSRSSLSPRMLARRALNYLLAQRARNRSLDLMPLLRCPGCLGCSLSNDGTSVTCTACASSYPVADGALLMVPPALAPLGGAR